MPNRNKRKFWWKIEPTYTRIMPNLAVQFNRFTKKLIHTSKMFHRNEVFHQMIRIMTLHYRQLPINQLLCRHVKMASFLC